MLSGQQIKDAVSVMLTNEVSKIISPTATGKSTMIPIEAYKQLKGLLRRPVRIVVSVPTRIAAQSLASWVKDRNKDEETVVDSQFAGSYAKANANIVYSTAAILLQDYMKVIQDKDNTDPKPFPWDFIIIDEVHTGSVENSLIFSFHERMMSRFASRGLKIPPLTLMTATDVDIPNFTFDVQNEIIITPDDISYTVGGRPVRKNIKTFFLEKSIPPVDVSREMARTIKKILETKTPYTVLAFVEGIRSLNILQQTLSEMNIGNLNIIRAYGGMSQEENNKIFSKKRPGERRVVIATDIAESSVTVPDVAYVVDSMLSKRPAKGIVGANATLVLGYISKNSSDQRRGRAGRGMVPEQLYYPMMTEEEFVTKVMNNPRRVPDIKLVALEKIALLLISRGFNPRLFLAEAGQESITETIINLIESKAIVITKLIPLVNSSVSLEEKELLKAVGKKTISIHNLREYLPLFEKGLLIEEVEITEFGRFWSTFSIGLLPTRALWIWVGKKAPVLMGCLVAAIMESDFTKLFPIPYSEDIKLATITETTQKINRFVKRDYYSEKTPEYISHDPLTTILCVVYDYFKSYPEVLYFDFDYIKVKSWCDKKGLNGKVLYEIFNIWKKISSKLNEQSHYDFRLQLELAETIQMLIDCLANESFFSLRRAKNFYRRENSMTNCTVDVSSVPYNAYYNPPKLIFLNITESIFENTRIESTSLFVPTTFIASIHYKEQFLLPKQYVDKHIIFDETDIESMDIRMPTVEPEDIGLFSGSFSVPISLSLAGELKLTDDSVRKRRFPMAIYPGILTPMFFAHEKKLYSREEEDFSFSEMFEGIDIDSIFEPQFSMDMFSLLENIGKTNFSNLAGEGLTIEQALDTEGTVVTY